MPYAYANTTNIIRQERHAIYFSRGTGQEQRDKKAKIEPVPRQIRKRYEEIYSKKRFIVASPNPSAIYIFHSTMVTSLLIQDTIILYDTNNTVVVGTCYYLSYSVQTVFNSSSSCAVVLIVVLIVDNRSRAIKNPIIYHSSTYTSAKMQSSGRPPTTTVDGRTHRPPEGRDTRRVLASKKARPLYSHHTEFLSFWEVVARPRN